MTTLDKIILTALTKNAATFLNCSINALNRGLADYGNKVIALVNLQMALELAMKAKVAERFGTAYIVHNLPEGATERDIQLKYENNTLRIKEFESLKNLLKAHHMFGFERPEYAYIDRFQTYRNRLVHFNYNFSKDEEAQISQDIIYVLVYLLGALMSDSLKSERPDYMQEFIDMAEYNRLLDNPCYQAELKEFILDTYGDVYFCPHCSRELMAPNKKCLACFSEIGEEVGHGFTACCSCGDISSLLYDRLNIDLNNGATDGLCLRCQSRTTVYKCSRCGVVTDLKNPADHCTFDYCCFFDEDDAADSQE